MAKFNLLLDLNKTPNSVHAAVLTHGQHHTSRPTNRGLL